MTRPAAFIDKDGTLIQDIPHNVDPSRIRLMPGAVEGLLRLRAAGYAVIVISNQPGIAHGLFPESAMSRVRRRLEELLNAIRVPLAGFYYCPHHPAGRVPPYGGHCACRKPMPGLMFRAAREHGLPLEQCWMIGDILDDIEAGRRAGCRTVLVDHGHETEWRLSPVRTPDFVVRRLSEAARIIVPAQYDGDQKISPAVLS